MIKLPKAMCTQHPDSASRYISTKEEVGEAIECFARYGCDEYMPDYEGKTTPYHQNLQIVAKLLEETGMIPSADVYITPGAPGASHENRFRQKHLRYLAKTGGSKTCGESAGITGSALLKMAIIRKSPG